MPMPSPIQQSRAVSSTEDHVQGIFSQEPSGHDWWHIKRVVGLALALTAKEGGDPLIVQLAALLHEYGDWKLELTLPEPLPTASAWLETLELPRRTIDHIAAIVDRVSFRGHGPSPQMMTLEGMVVQDADRLDAIGAIGIARAFTFGGCMKRPIHNPDTRPQLYRDYSTYKSATPTVINHFYEKLLLLTDFMNTPTARTMAIERHKFMQIYLQQFSKEWVQSSLDGPGE